MLARGSVTNIKQEKIPEFRLKMIEEIYEGKIKSSGKPNLFMNARKSIFLNVPKIKVKTPVQTPKITKNSQHKIHSVGRKEKIKWPKSSCSEEIM